MSLSWLTTLGAGMSDTPLNITVNLSSFSGQIVPSTSIIPSRSPSGVLIVMLLIIGYVIYFFLFYLLEIEFGFSSILCYEELIVHSRWLGSKISNDIPPRVNLYIASCPGWGGMRPGKVGADIHIQSPRLNSDIADLRVGLSSARLFIAFWTAGCDVSEKWLLRMDFREVLRYSIFKDEFFKSWT